MTGFSIFLIAVGAILRFAVTTSVEGIDLATAGVVLMVVGAVGLVYALVQGIGGHRTERHVSEDGRHVVEESRTAY